MGGLYQSGIGGYWSSRIDRSSQLQAGALIKFSLFTLGRLDEKVRDPYQQGKNQPPDRHLQQIAQGIQRANPLLQLF